MNVANGESRIPADRGNLEKVPFCVADPELIPSQRYYDQRFFDQEKEKLWPHVWQMACRLEEIPAVGDYVEYSNLGKSVIVVRTDDGVKAFHNACRHRGLQLAAGPGNCKARGFICPFHGWRYNMNGENTFVFGRQIFSERVLGKSDISLKPCRVDTALGCAFINFDDGAPSLHECLAPVVERMKHHNFDALRAKWWHGTVLPTNWKLAMEAFQEGYHVMKTHPQIFGIGLPNPYGEDLGEPVKATSGKEFAKTFLLTLSSLHDGMGGQVSPREVAIAEDLQAMELPDDAGEAAGLFMSRFLQEITARGRAEGRAVPDMTEMFSQDHHRDVEFMFPHFFYITNFSAMSVYRVRPMTAETCLFEIWSLDYLKEGEVERLRGPVMLPHDSQDFPDIPKQDYSNLPRQQSGLHAEGFDHMRLSNRFEGLISNYHRLIDGYLAGLDSETLAAGTRAVNQGYDTPIADIGF